MRGKDLMAWTVKDRRDAHFCFHGAKTMLQYLDAMTGMIEGVRQNEDIECLHRMRVASRRLRSLLPLFDDCLPARQTARWRRRLRRVTRALGEARDADVQAVFLLDALKACKSDSQRPGLERLLLRSRQRRSALQAPLSNTLERLVSGRRMRRLEMALRYLLATSQLYADADSARHTYDRCRSAVMRRLQAVLAAAAAIRGPHSNTELHTTRIAVKRLRYTLQAFAPLYPDTVNDAIRTARRLQDVLGNVHDCDVWVETLPEFLEAEKARTVAYFGSSEPFEPLVAGVTAFRNERQRLREKYYRDFAALWRKTRDRDVWGELCRALEAASVPGSVLGNDEGSTAPPSDAAVVETESSVPAELVRLEPNLRASPQGWQWHVASLIASVPAGKLVTYGRLAQLANASYGLQVGASNVAWLRTHLQNLLGNTTAVPLHRLAKTGDPYSRRETPARKQLNDRLRAAEGSLADPVWWQP